MDILTVLQQQLKRLKVNEGEFAKNIGMELSTIAQAIYYGLKKPESADWELLSRIKKLYPGIEFEKIKDADPIIKKPIDRSKHSDELEKTFVRDMGARLKQIRKSRGFSAEYMGKLTGIKGNAYSQMENGFSHINAYRLYFYSKALNVPYDVLLGDDNSNYPDILSEELKKYKKIVADLKKEIATKDGLIKKYEKSDKILKELTQKFGLKR